MGKLLEVIEEEKPLVEKMLKQGYKGNYAPDLRCEYAVSKLSKDVASAFADSNPRAEKYWPGILLGIEHNIVTHGGIVPQRSFEREFINTMMQTTVGLLRIVGKLKKG